MLLTDPIFLSIMFFGIWTSYTDIKDGKIRNLTVTILLLSGLFINIFYTRSLINSTLQVLINSGISLLVGYLMWEFGFWSPADAKLFFAFSFLIPIETYKIGSISYFPSYIILVNTFAPAAIFFLLYSIIKMEFKFLREELKDFLKLGPLINMGVFIVGISSLFIFLNKIFNLKVNLGFQFIFMFLISDLMEKKYFKFVFIIFLILGIIVAPKNILSFSFLKASIVTLFVFQGIRLLINNLHQFSLTKEVKIKDLEPGMVLGENMSKKKGEYSKESITLINYFDIMRHIRKNISSEFTGKLSEKDIKKIKRLKKENKIEFESLRITNSIPFAPFMFSGAMVTYLIQGSLAFHLITLKDYLVMYSKFIFYKLGIFLS